MDLTDKWKHILEDQTTPREADTVAEKWRLRAEKADDALNFNPSSREGTPRTSRGKKDAIAGQFRQWAAGRSALQAQLGAHSMWLRNFQRKAELSRGGRRSATGPARSSR